MTEYERIIQEFKEQLDYEIENYKYDDNYIEINVNLKKIRNERTLEANCNSSNRSNNINNNNNTPKQKNKEESK